MIKSQKLEKYLILANNLIFILLYIGLSYYNRPAHDDFYSMYMVREFGVFDGTIYQYHNWCTRYFGVFLSFFITSLKTNYKYFIFNGFLLLVYLTAIFQLLKVLVKQQGISVLNNINLSIFIVSALFYSSISIGETWFWLSANTAYTLSFGLLIIGLAKVLSNKAGLVEFMVIAMVFLFLGGSNELLALFYSLIVISVLLFGNKAKLLVLHKIKLVISLFFVMLSLMILVGGPGNAIRENSFHTIGIIGALLLNVKLTGVLLFDKFIWVLPATFLCAIMISMVIKPYVTFMSNLAHTKKIILSILGFVLLVYLFQLPVTYKTHDIAAIRSLLPLSTVLLFIMVWFFSSIQFRTLFRITLLAIVLLAQLYFCIDKTLVAQEYSKAHDKRMDYIQKQRNVVSDTIFVALLPTSGWLFSSEISNNPAHYSNQQLKKGLKVQAEIVVSK